MENASKALWLAAEMLLGVMILMVVVVSFTAVQDFSSEIDGNIQSKMVAEFNSKFEPYNNRNNLTPQDVVTLVNLVKDYNSKEDRYKEITIVFEGGGIDGKYKTMINTYSINSNIADQFIQAYAPKEQVVNGKKTLIYTKFTCEMEYDATRGYVSTIKLKKT